MYEENRPALAPDDPAKKAQELSAPCHEEGWSGLSGSLIEKSADERRRNAHGELTPRPLCRLHTCECVEEALCFLSTQALDAVLLELKNFLLKAHSKTGCKCGQPDPGISLLTWLYEAEPWSVPLQTPPKSAEESITKRGMRMMGDWASMTLFAAKLLFLLSQPEEGCYLDKLPNKHEITANIERKQFHPTDSSLTPLLAIQLPLCQHALRSKGIDCDVSHLFKLAGNGRFIPGLHRFKKCEGKWRCGLCLVTFACERYGRKHLRKSTTHARLAEQFLGLPPPPDSSSPGPSAAEPDSGKRPRSSDGSMETQGTPDSETATKVARAEPATSGGKQG